MARRNNQENDQTRDQAQDQDKAQEKWPTDDSGNLIDPPVIRSFERDLADAANSGDDNAVSEVMKRYNDARKKAVS